MLTAKPSPIWILTDWKPGRSCSLRYSCAPLYLDLRYLPLCHQGRGNIKTAKIEIAAEIENNQVEWSLQSRERVRESTVAEFHKLC